MAKIILSGYIEVPHEDLELVKYELQNHIKLTHQESGCIKFEVTQREASTNIFEVYEEFSSKEAFDFHQDRVRNSKWGQVSKNVKRNYQIEEIK